MMNPLKNGVLFLKKTLRLVVTLFFLQNLLFAESIRDDLDYFFEEPYSYTGAKCKADCRPIDIDLQNKYMTKIIDFDASTGITTCEVFAKTSGNNILGKLSINANSQNLKCVDEYNAMKIDYKDDSLNSIKFDKEKKIVEITDYDRSTVTMSRFIGGLATLDDDVIDIANSTKGEISKRNDGAIYQINSADKKDPNTLLNTIDKLSTNNLSYYVDLFYSMDKIYEYLVAYVFVFISLFFMILYASKIALKKVAKKTTAFDEPWQTKVAVIVFSTVIFFIPMKLDSEYSSTLFQNMWKYFVEESSSIADKANTIGMKTYMKKVYNTTGASGVETEANLVLIQKQQAYLLEEYNENMELCKKRYPYELTFQKTNLEQIKQIEEYAGGADDKLTLRACRAIEKRMKLSHTAHEQAEISLKRISAAYTESYEIGDRLKAMTEHVDTRVKELGWYSALLAPTLQVLTKISFLQNTQNITVNDVFSAKINEASAEKIAINEQESKNTGKFKDLLDTQINASKDDPTKRTLGEILSKTAFVSLIPGASSIQKFFQDLGGQNIEALIKQLPVDKNYGMLGDLPKDTKNLVFTTTLLQYIIEVLPFVTTFIAIGIMIILYIYELIVFSFVSPFIVAFAVTTGQSRKILDFLVTALTIFLKPTLIVIAIYLTLFLYSIFQDIFILMADEQFYLSLNSTTAFMPSLIFHFVKEMLYIFAVFASVFFMWKLIMQMPDFIFKLVGLEGLGSSSQMANSMQQSFGKFGFKA